jgi:hypothetical protein
MRDMLLTDYIRKEVESRGLMLYEVDGSRSAEEMAGLIEGQFSQ